MRFDVGVVAHNFYGVKADAIAMEVANNRTCLFNLYKQDCDMGYQGSYDSYLKSFLTQYAVQRG